MGKLANQHSWYLTQIYNTLTIFFYRHNTGLCTSNFRKTASSTCYDTDTTLLDAIDAGIDNAKITCSRIIVAGYINVHNAAWLGSTRTTVAGEAAEDLCYLHCLEQHVQDPTRGRNLLDLIMSDRSGNISTSTHQPLGNSDHATVLADLDQLPLREPPSTIPVWRYQRADWWPLRAFFSPMWLAQYC